MKVKNFRELDVWRLGMEIVKLVYELTNEFPNKEVFGLSAQMRKAAVSIPSNIAEGFNRIHSKEFKQFLYISYGSCSELETQTEISYGQKFIKEEQRNGLLELLNHESRMLKNLIKSIS